MFQIENSIPLCLFQAMLIREYTLYLTEICFFFFSTKIFSGLMLLDQTDDDLLDEGDERTSVLATLCLMTNQRQLEHCLQFRLFAARNAFQRHRLVREFFAQYRWRVMNKDRQVFQFLVLNLSLFFLIFVERNDNSHKENTFFMLRWCRTIFR